MRDSWMRGLVRGGVSLLAAAEHGLLGRGRPVVEAALDECVACVGDGAWCGCCGARMEGPPTPGMTMPEAQGLLCALCGGHGPYHGFVRLARYEPPMDRLVRRVKEQAWHAMAQEIGLRLGLEVRRQLPAPTGGWLVVPVPANFWRRLARGMDHSYAIACGVAQGSGGTVLRALRMRHVRRQAGMDRAHRWSRVRRFGPRRKVRSQLEGRSVLLVDDVRTTGATLFEARELLIHLGVQSVSVAVACVADRSQVSTAKQLANAAVPV